MSTGKGGKAKRGPATEPAGSTDVASLCRAFLAERDPKSAASFTKLASLSVATSYECSLLFSTIIDACVAHPRNRAAAGPSVVRRLCGLMSDGVVNGEPNTHDWCLALMHIFEFHGEDTAALDAKLSAFLSAGGVELLIAALKSYTRSENICKFSMAIMSMEYMPPSSTLRMDLRMHSCGSVRAIYSAMATHVPSHMLQKTGLLAIKAHIPEIRTGGQVASDGTCRTILGLPVRGDAMDGVLLSGGLARIYAAMDAHLADVETQIVACELLAEAASSADSDEAALGSLRLVTTGALARIYAAMSAHPSSEALHKLAMHAFSRVSRTTTGQSAIVSTGGIRHVYATMKAHSRSTSVLFLACKALQNIAGEHARAVAAIVSSGGLDHLYTAMSAHPSCEDVQEAASAAMCNLLGGDYGVNVMILDSGGLERLLAAMAAHRASPAVQGTVCSTLRGIAHHLGPPYITRLASSAVLDRICSAMRAHPRSEFVQDAGCGALRNIAASPDNMVAVASGGGLECLYAAMSGHPGSTDVQEAGLGALLNLTKVPENVGVMKAGRAVALVKKAMATHPTPYVLQRGPAVLANLR